MAGSEAAAQFTARGVLCIVVEQNARPYGKIEDGLPRWHVKLRESEEDKIDAKLSQPSVLFAPRTRLGRDVSLDELRSWGLSAIVLANGAWRDRPLPVPNADAYVGRGFYYQNPYVMWFNHYIEPDYAGPQYEVPDGALVVGGGLASLDVVKILQLETAVRALAARGISVDLYEVEKRGVKKTLEERGHSLEALGLKGCALVYRRTVEDMPVAEPPDGATPEQMERTRATRRKLLMNFKEKYLFRFQDRLAPVEALVEGDRMAGLRLQRTEVRDGSVHVLPNQAVEIRAPLVISSIGSIPESVDGLKMRGELYPVKDKEMGELEGLPGVFAIGNAVTGKGNILVSLKHGRKASQQILESYLMGDATGFEQVLDAAAAEAGSRTAPVARRVEAAPLLPPERVKTIVEKARALQARAGYPGDYWDWIATVRPARPPKR